MANGNLLRLSSTLLFIGLVLTDILHFLHPAGGSSYEATFTIYAASKNWAAIHLAQFVGEAVLLVGLLILVFALNVSEGILRWLAIFSAISAGVAIALAGLLYAVDGVAPKQTSDAFASAPATEQAARLASAEAIRWLEWGTNSYWNFMQGLAEVLCAIVIAWTGRVPRPIGYLMGLSGGAFIVLGWMIGAHGFTIDGNVPSYTAYTLFLVLIVWLLAIAWRLNGSVVALRVPEARTK